MAKQTQIQRTRPAPKPATAPSDAPTVNKRIARIWFNGGA
jgi:hypothetical protein